MLEANTIIWLLKKQPIIALSSFKAEYMDYTIATKESALAEKAHKGLWTKNTKTNANLLQQWK